MQTYDSVIQNRCRMQGRCVAGGNSSTASLGAILFLQYLYFKGTCPEAKKKKTKKCAVLTCVCACSWQFFDLKFAATVKT